METTTMKRRDFLGNSLLAASALGLRSAYAVTSTHNTDVLAVTGDGKEITLRAAEIRELAGALQGQLLLAGDNGYDVARLVMNPSFNKHPALIARPSNAADVQKVVSFAREHSLLVAVKCGGHSHSGQSTCDKGLQIDLSNFRGAVADAATKRVNVAGGTLLGQVDQAAMAQGLVTPLGTVSHTGVGGLTLGGGFGRLARRFGMAIDNLESLDVVSADGKLRHASATENPELFWGLRGGGGNFGIVTNFEFRLHPMQRQVIAGELDFPIEKARDVLRAWGDYALTAPDELYMDPIMMIPAGGAPGSISIEVCYSGAPENAERALAPLRKIGTPTRDSIKAEDYLVVQRRGDTRDPRAIGSYLKGGFIPQVPDKLVSTLVENFQGHPGRFTLIFFQHCGGAGGRVAEGSTAFAQRNALANMMAVSAWRQGDDPAEHIKATREYWSKIEPFTHGFYVNDLPREVTVKEINANYRGNFARLVKLKQTYDPTNLFRLNANVKPAGTV
jgi:FAD/FMN-containing dehydrogenase